MNHKFGTPPTQRDDGRSHSGNATVPTPTTPTPRAQLDGTLAAGDSTAGGIAIDKGGGTHDASVDGRTSGAFCRPIALAVAAEGTDAFCPASTDNLELK